MSDFLERFRTVLTGGKATQTELDRLEQDLNAELEALQTRAGALEAELVMGETPEQIDALARVEVQKTLLGRRRAAIRLERRKAAQRALLAAFEQSCQRQADLSKTNNKLTADLKAALEQAEALRDKLLSVRLELDGIGVVRGAAWRQVFEEHGLDLETEGKALLETMRADMETIKGKWGVE